MIPTDDPLNVRRGTPADAVAIVSIWAAIVSERVYSAVDRPFTVESERAYLQALSAEEAVFVAETMEGQVVGFQTFDRWTKLFHSMNHVGQVGTFVLEQWRGRGLGRQLAAQTLTFARSARYEKLVVLVRAGNTGAQRFYAALGFSPCGRLVRQVKIADEYDDEIVMEMFL